MECCFWGNESGISWILFYRNDKESLSDIEPEGWEELGRIVKELERVCKKVFGATMFNFSCLMNNAYKDDTKPMVHFHFMPRYKDKVELFGKVYEDVHFDIIFGNGQMMKKIAKKIYLLTKKK